MKKRILVAPLNWGLGHATRCIPIIKALISCGFEPIIGSDGEALELLKKEFPDVVAVELPSYNIHYSRQKVFFKLKLLKNTPSILKAINAEKKTTIRVIKTYGITGIISDNRWGVYNSNVPSTIITHQLNVLSGQTTWLSTWAHKLFLKNFDACWVPDVAGENNLSGILGQGYNSKTPIKHIGPLSRFVKRDTTPINKLLVVLSGPEPQRTLLYKKLLYELGNYKEKVIMVKGMVENKQTIETVGQITVYNYMTSEDLEKAIQESELIISRSGYTSIMDMAKLAKKAFFIPTPGQYEQEYLAKRLFELNTAPFCKQDDFTFNQLKQVEHFNGFESLNFETDFENLFRFFEGE